MSSIPASQFVEIIPGVLSAGGNGLHNNGLVLTENPRIPAGSVLSFASAPNVASYFGASSTEAKIAGGGAGIGSGYFGGFNNAQAVPQARRLHSRNHHHSRRNHRSHNRENNKAIVVFTHA